MHDLEVSACHKPEPKTTQMREVELALVVCEAAGEPTQDHESRQACFASHSAVAVAILARFNRFRVNFEAISVKPFPYLAFPHFVGLKARSRFQVLMAS